MNINTYSSYLSANTTRNKLENELTNTDKTNDSELEQACKQFEAYFIEQMFKEMRKSIPDSSLTEKSQGKEIFEDMLYQQYAINASKGRGVGLAKSLYEQLSNK